MATSRAAVREMLRDERRALWVYDQNPRQHRELFGDSIFSVNGGGHARTRDLLATSLVARNQLRRYAPKVAAICAHHVEAWRGRGVDDLMSATRELTTQICAEVVVGVAESSEREEFHQAIDAFLAAVPVKGRTRWLSARYRRGLRAARTVRRLCARRMESGCSPDTVLGQLVRHAPDERTRRSLPHEILALLVAARETTAALLLWAVVELSLDAEGRQAIRAELADVAESVTLLDRRTCSALYALIDRAAHLHSPNMLALRRLASPLALGGRQLGEGALVAYSPSLGSLNGAQSRHHTAGGSSPPSDCPASSDPGPAADSLAFGYGVRACPGKRLGELIAAALIAAVLPELTPRVEVEDLAFGVSFLPLRVPVRPVRLRLEGNRDEGR
ncbi:cytochrome P450 [Streptomyces canus]|uniref:cytochrome P450 n=1 Tax=Streptomyces canus TaxID=58343 RepID=UPI0030DFDCE7